MTFEPAWVLNIVDSYVRLITRKYYFWKKDPRTVCGIMKIWASKGDPLCYGYSIGCSHFCNRLCQKPGITASDALDMVKKLLPWMIGAGMDCLQASLGMNLNYGERLFCE